MRQNASATLALFNVGNGRTTRAIDRARAGLDGGRRYAVTDPWTGAGSSARGTLSVTIDGKRAKLFRLDQ
jgi:hypothetical protein